MKPAILVGLFICLLLSACGGSGGTSASRQGKLRFQIEWPDNTRLVPVAAKSVVISASVTKGEDLLGQPTWERITFKVVPKPSSGGISTVEMNLPSTRVMIQVDASPNLEGTGNVQATAKKEVTIRENTEERIAISMVTRISSVKLSPEVEPLTQGWTVTYNARAESDDGVIVVTSRDKWSWASSDPTVLSVTPDGDSATVRGLKPGTVTLTATEEESHRAKVATVQVKAAVDQHPPVPPGRYKGVLWCYYRRADYAMDVSGHTITWSAFWDDGSEHVWARIDYAETSLLPDGSISFWAMGLPEDDYLFYGDTAVVEGTYKDGKLNVFVWFSQDGVVDPSSHGSGVFE